MEDCDRRFRIVLIGDSTVGKSSICNRFTKDVYSDSFMTTIGMDYTFKTVKVDGKRVKLQIWDTAGQERYRVISSSYYRRADAILFVYDITSQESFDHIANWVELSAEDAPEQCIRFLVGNKIDNDPSNSVHVISKEQAVESARELHLEGPFEVSAKTSKNIDYLFAQVASLLLENSYARKMNDIAGGGGGGGDDSSAPLVSVANPNYSFRCFSCC